MLRLFGGKSDHPMADIASAQALLDEIPKHDAIKALQELTAWIGSVRDESGFRLDHQLAVLCLLDEAARPLARELTYDYFSAHSLSTFQENRLWAALSGFFDQLLQAYHTVLVRYRNGDKGSAAIKLALPLLVTRGISAARGKLKYAAARYALVEQATWAHLAEFYVHAETHQYLGEQVQLQGGSDALTSVRDELAAVLIWYASSAATLNRLDAHLAERLLAHLAHDFSVGTQYEPTTSCFGFDLMRPAPPMRVSMETVPRPTMRFLGVHKLPWRIEALLDALQGSVVPEEIDLGGVYGVDAVRGVLKHLAESLAFPQPQRRHARRNISLSMNVANGFYKVMEQTNIGLNLGHDNATSCEVEDISMGGFRCILPAPRPGEMAIGSLMGIRPENLDRWGVGIVRRISRDPMSNLHVGVEVLTNKVTGVGLRRYFEDDVQPALWLHNSIDDADDDSSEVNLLMSSETYSASRKLRVTLANRNYVLEPLALMEKGEDYDLVRFRRIESDHAAHDFN